MSVLIDGSAGVTTNAGGSVNPSTNVEGINYSCRAWVNFNGTGTVAIRASGNVTDITDGGTGIYTVNFTTSMPDANYAENVSCNYRTGSGVGTIAQILTQTTSNTQVFSIEEAGGAIDTDVYCVAVFR